VETGNSELAEESLDLGKDEGRVLKTQLEGCYRQVEDGLPEVKNRPLKIRIKVLLQ